ncbi:hypothetical protein QBC38DRAFT_503296 [Podospora fimiseda]|uniref:Uncharacterized protein n=1 Tax=Podospora fimiseda TaxID=252190 RepID=A0AAN7BH44_9PEZI|nr:hypothetical protein QBC38DRAFT_503296 [Podospora fimiseda]
MLGLYAELQRDRMDRLLAALFEVRDQNLESLAIGNEQDNSSTTRTWSVSDRLERIIRQIGKKSSAFQEKKFAEATDRFECRFEEISIELDGFMANCRIVAEDLAVAVDLFTSEMTRESLQIAHQAKNGTAIAFLAMIYLPHPCSCIEYSL